MEVNLQSLQGNFRFLMNCFVPLDLNGDLSLHLGLNLYLTGPRWQVPSYKETAWENPLSSRNSLFPSIVWWTIPKK